VHGELVSERLARLRSFDPLTEAWLEAGLVSIGEADLIVSVVEATARRQPQRLAYPGNGARLAALISVELAVARMARPPRYPRGPVTLVAGPRERATLEAALPDGDAGAALGPARLRGDGLVQRRSTTRALEGSDHLLVVSPLVRWPDPGHRLGVAVLAERSLASSFDDALEWATHHAEVVHVCTGLDPQFEPSGIEVDWPTIAAEIDAWRGLGTGWALAGPVQLEVVQPEPNGLVEARRRIANVGDRSDWPTPLIAAAALSRILAGAAVPIPLLDLHQRNPIAQSIADRVEVLERTRPGDFPPAWRTFAETDWPIVKRRLLDAYSELEEHNHKADVIGIVVERALATGDRVAVWTDSTTHADALATHLLTAGFGITPAAVESGALAIRALHATRGEALEPTLSILTGLPAPWNFTRVLSADITGSSTICCYPFEAERLPRLLNWLVNWKVEDRWRERSSQFEQLLAGVQPEPVPPRLNIETRATTNAAIEMSASTDTSSDAAELAALADDDWLKLIKPETEAPYAGSEPRAALAFLTDPGPAILLLAHDAVVDRVIGRRLWPMPATGVGPGMTLFVGAERATSLFTALRPYLDRLQGLGTRFWLEQWERARRDAAEVTGGPGPFAAELVRRGAPTIGAQAVAEWASPYRIGPRDWQHVEATARIAGDLVVEHHAKRIAAVMRGVRVEHMRVGRQLVQAIRRQLAGDADAFDVVEDRLGVEASHLVGDITITTVCECLGSGTAPAAAIGRTHTPQRAQDLFAPETT
jgi:hypothetical protein